MSTDRSDPHGYLSSQYQVLLPGFRSTLLSYSPKQ